MRTLKFPCLKCGKSVKKTQKGLQCNNCDLWIHQKCTPLTEDEYDYLEQNEDEPYYCELCEHNITTKSGSHCDSTFLSEQSSPSSSDFDFVDDEDDVSSLRGLNFQAL